MSKSEDKRREVQQPTPDDGCDVVAVYATVDDLTRGLEEADAYMDSLERRIQYLTTERHWAVAKMAMKVVELEAEVERLAQIGHDVCEEKDQRIRELEDGYSRAVKASGKKHRRDMEALTHRIKELETHLADAQYNIKVFEAENKRITELEAERDAYKRDLGINRKMRRYIAFVLTGDEGADAQLAADNVMADNRRLREALRWLSDRYLANPNTSSDFVVCITPERVSEYKRKWREAYRLSHDVDLVECVDFEDERDAPSNEDMNTWHGMRWPFT